MKALIAALRWLVFVPVGLISGSTACSIVMGFGGLLLGGWAIPGAVILFLAGMIHPIAGYSIGQIVAPSQNRASRWLLKAPYLLMGFGMFCSGVAMIFGADVKSFESDIMSFYTGLTPWWQTLAYIWGTVYGTGIILEVTSTPSIQAAVREKPVSPFDWNEWAKMWG
jgi:hypothetical protein